MIFFVIDDVSITADGKDAYEVIKNSGMYK